MGAAPYFCQNLLWLDMILTCPSCDTRYSVDAAKFPPTGRTVRCAKCGLSWHQAGETPEPAEVSQTLSGQSAGQGPQVAEPPPAGTYDDDVAAVAAPFAPESVSPARGFGPAATVDKPSSPMAPRLAVVAGWAGLIAVVLAIAFAAVRYRQDIATIWPQSAGVYSSLGLHVNSSGIDFRQVEYRRESEDGQVVLAVSGQIVNTGPREMPVPQTVRVTLSDASNHELYHWTFKPNAQVLTPGQAVKFVTRLASPPAAARHLEVRFAKDGS
jgi:predicted Zn finger-like uncharacterized protein